MIFVAHYESGKKVTIEINDENSALSYFSSCSRGYSYTVSTYYDWDEYNENEE